MMTFAYLVLAHENFPQLRQLIDELLASSREDFVVLHVDGRSAPDPTWVAKLRADHKDRLIWIEDRVTVYWGHYSQVAALDRLMAAALRRPFDLAHLVSGSDWPIADRATIIAQLEKDSEVGPHGERQLGCYAYCGGPTQQQRMQDFFFYDTELHPFLRGSLRERLGRESRKLTSRLWSRLWQALGGKRSTPYGPTWRHGATWWSLPKDVVEQIQPEVALLLASGRLRYTCCADEHVIPTLLHVRYPQRVRPFRRFMNWLPGRPGPETLTQADAAALRQSGAWFARKCDAQHDDFFLRARLAA